MAGGCCGTAPEYITAVRERVKGITPRQISKEPIGVAMFSGQQEFIWREEVKFVNVGERCNISGSIQFKNMIKKGEFEKAIKVAKD
jgi:5-methyltetrahydrofolate--homocysteine methyltransferase